MIHREDGVKGNRYVECQHKILSLILFHEQKKV
jgi:hypothetical protein